MWLVTKEGGDCLREREARRKRKDKSWIMSSTAPEHLDWSCSLLTDFRSSTNQPGFINIIGDKMEVRGEGDIAVWTEPEKRPQVKNVLYVPQLSPNMISIPALGDRGYGIRVDQQAMHVWQWDETVMEVSQNDKV
jgi:hypothetical protein